MLKLFNASIAVLSLTTVAFGTLGALLYSPSASAKTLVTCGPHGAAFIVETVPAGCRVLGAASPPKQAGNAVSGSQLGFSFTASALPSARTKDAIAFARDTQLLHF